MGRKATPGVRKEDLPGVTAAPPAMAGLDVMPIAPSVDGKGSLTNNLRGSSLATNTEGEGVPLPFATGVPAPTDPGVAVPLVNRGLAEEVLERREKEVGAPAPCLALRLVPNRGVKVRGVMRATGRGGPATGEAN